MDVPKAHGVRRERGDSQAPDALDSQPGQFTIKREKAREDLQDRSAQVSAAGSLASPMFSLMGMGILNGFEMRWTYFRRCVFHAPKHPIAMTLGQIASLGGAGCRLATAGDPAEQKGAWFRG
jgi:hypothetical protein